MKNQLFIPDPNFQTPLHICQYMVEMVPAQARNILEPTPGLGNLVAELKKVGTGGYGPKYNITAPEDFFLEPKRHYDCVVMNPPFTAKSAFLQNAPANAETKGMKIGYHILKACMEMSDNIIALMPWYTIADSDVRLRELKSFGMKSLTALPRKTFNYARVQTVIIELDRQYKGPTIFNTL